MSVNDDESVATVLSEIGKAAADPASSFTWLDAAIGHGGTSGRTDDAGTPIDVSHDSS